MLYGYELVFTLKEMMRGQALLNYVNLLPDMLSLVVTKTQKDDTEKGTKFIYILVCVRIPKMPEVSIFRE